ncbi:hypothetical protein RCF98_07180 [Thiothrix lacustris]|uniref:Uncharacterized protein n=1 Tax=Thiothrix lacustris TaxID=525917 RepID=A0ABY9MUB2_9GAMM|nr:hypothetical protein [Thiothrix lacustris]WML92118.1 hypothetical protein RCF98_07180 [Thiothrix lacustris]
MGTSPSFAKITGGDNLEGCTTPFCVRKISDIGCDQVIAITGKRAFKYQVVVKVV